MQSQVEAVLVKAPQDFLDQVPLVDAHEALHEPKPEVVVHCLSLEPDCFLLDNLLFEHTLIGLFVHDRLKQRSVLILSQLNLFLEECLYLIQLFL